MVIDDRLPVRATSALTHSLREALLIQAITSKGGKGAEQFTEGEYTGKKLSSATDPTWLECV